MQLPNVSTKRQVINHACRQSIIPK